MLTKITMTIWSDEKPRKVEQFDPSAIAERAESGDMILSELKAENVTDRDEIPEGVLSFFNVLEDDDD